MFSYFLKRSITVFLGLIIVSSGVLPATAGNNSAVTTLQVSRLGDVELSCHALSQEATLMRDIVATTQDIKENTEFNERGIGVAGAIGGLVVGTATGGIGLAAAGFIANHLNDEKNEEADEVQDIAAQRRILMMGIFNAKGCVGPIEHAMHIPEPIQIGEAPEEVTEHLASIAPAAGNDYYGDLRRRYNE